MRLIQTELPELVPSAHHFDIAICDDPECGAHIISYDRAGAVICQTVVGRAHIPSVIARLKEIYRNPPGQH